ncbi:hypothetical protein [Streptomyces sp. NPDC056304]|uniref:hypothetical protein n=2 Tax=Streptomyces TaxID=1883 RepID=UPI0035D81947
MPVRPRKLPGGPHSVALLRPVGWRNAWTGMTTARCSATRVKAICRRVGSWPIAGAVLDHPAVGAERLTGDGGKPYLTPLALDLQSDIGAPPRRPRRSRQTRGGRSRTSRGRRDIGRAAGNHR